MNTLNTLHLTAVIETVYILFMLNALKAALLAAKLAHPVMHAQDVEARYARALTARRFVVGGQTAEGKAMAQDFNDDVAEGAQQ